MKSSFEEVTCSFAEQMHLGLIMNMQQNPGWAHPTGGTHKKFTFHSLPATKESSQTSEPHLSNKSNTTLCRDDWNETPLCYFPVFCEFSTAKRFQIDMLWRPKSSAYLENTCRGKSSKTYTYFSHLFQPAKAEMTDKGPKWGTHINY